MLLYNIDMEIEIIRQKRKSLVLNIQDSQHAIVKAPLKMSMGDIEKFVESKKDWLKKHATILQQSELIEKDFQLDKYIYCYAKPVACIEQLNAKFSNLSQNGKKRFIKKCYLEMFDRLKEIAFEVSNKSGLKFDKITPTSSVRVWGSYNVNREMKLNFKLILLPKELIYYVVCHELCHSKHMNHKPVFWSAVSKICPNYKALRKKLGDYSFLLKDDFA